KGCEPCECDPTGVILSDNGMPQLQCNELDGRCYCKPGRGGRTCSDCEDYHWGDPATGECRKCECDRIGSATQQCDRNNGSCVCLPGSGGPLCNMCARGYTGQWPQCQACGECFQNWDEIIQNLRSQVEVLIETAKNVEDTGVASVYDNEFEKWKTINLKKELLNSVGGRITEISSNVDGADLELKSLVEEADRLTEKSQAFQENATLLRVADIQGAYNITRESAEKSSAAKLRTDQADLKITSAESSRQEATQLLDNNQLDFEKQFSENEMALVRIDKQ
ncbi:hypothetical protein WUBG_13590, partial [Wuchereria bancrofti]